MFSKSNLKKRNTIIFARKILIAITIISLLIPYVPIQHVEATAGGSQFTLTINPVETAGVSGDIGGNTGLAEIDYDSDGDQDFLGLKDLGGSYVFDFYRNNGSGGFTKITPNVTLPITNASQVTVADVNNDGHQDFIIPGADGTSSYFQNNGDGTFVSSTNPVETAGATINIGGNGNTGLAVIDYDSDGDQDFLGLKDLGGSYVYDFYRNNGNGSFTKVPPNVTIPITNASEVTVADVNNDGHQDFIIPGADGTSSYFQNNGDGTFVSSTNPVETAGATINIGGNGNTGLAVIDYDSDGDQDFLGLKDLGGGSYVYDFYRNNGNGSFTKVPSNVTLPIANASQVTVTDVDNDGDEDFFIPKGDGTAAYYRQDGTVVGSDNKPPKLPTKSPADGATGVNGDDDIVLTFDETIALAGTGNIKIYKASDNSLIESISANNAKVTGVGTSTITVNPSATLSDSTSYYVKIDKKAFFDEDGMTYKGIYDNTAYNFTIGDLTPPSASLTSTEINPPVNHIKNTNAGLVKLTNNGHATLVIEQVGGDNAQWTHVMEGVISVYDSSNQLIQKTPLFEADATNMVGSASIAPLKNGGFVVAWTDNSSSAYYQIYDNEGDKVGSPVKISDRSDVDGINPDTINVIGRQNGGFAVVFGTTSQQDVLATYSYNSGTFTEVNETVIGNNTNDNSILVDLPERDGVEIYVANAKPQVIELSDGSLIVEESMYVDYLNQVQPMGDFVFKFDSNGAPTNFGDGLQMKRINFMTHGDVHKGFDLVALSDGGFATVNSNKYEGVAGPARWDLAIFESNGTPRITNVLKQKAPLTDNTNPVERDYYGVTLAENADNIILGHSSMKINVQEIAGKISVLVGNNNGAFDILTVSPTDGSVIDSASNVGIAKNNAQDILIHPFRIKLPNGQWAYTYEEYFEECENGSCSYTTSNNYSANIEYKNSITFNFESRVKGLDSKNVVTQYLLGKTLVTQSEDGNLINGKSNASVGVDNYSLSTGATEKTVTFTVMGNRFDVKSMLFADGDTTSTEDETITITSSKGTITKTIANSGNATFDATTDDPNDYLKGISSFTITASDNVLNYLVMDEITIDNFVSVAATQIVSGDIPASTTGPFNKIISGHEFTFTPAPESTYVDLKNELGSEGFAGIYMMNCGKEVPTSGGSSDCATEFTITPPTGYSFDVSAFDYISDRNSDGTVELTVTLTHADGATSEKTYVLNGNSVKHTFTELLDAPNDVKSIKFFTNRLVYFNNFVIDDIKLLPASETTKYTVTYDGNTSDGGTVPTDSTEYAENDEVTVADKGTLTNTGKVFTGWNTKADGTGTAYAAGDKLTMGTADVTLYAQWAVETTFTAELKDTNSFFRPSTPYDLQEAGSNAETVYGASDLVLNEVDPDTQLSYARNYIVRKFVPSVTGKYTVEVTDATLFEGATPAELEKDTFMIIYKDSFDKDNPLTNVLVANEDIVAYGEPNEDLRSKIANQQLESGKTYYVVVTSSVAGITGNVDFKITGPGSIAITALSDDATLSDLALTDVTLDIEFDTTKTTYTADVDNSLTETTITAPATDAGATVVYKINDVVDADGTVSLDEGENKIEVIVTAADGTTKTYTVTVTRAEASQVETPFASPTGGAVLSGTTVTLSTSTDSATIYYTTDGSEPTTSSTTYDSAITVTTAVTIKAIAVKDGMTNSAVMSESYTITLPAPTDISAIASDSSATINFTLPSNTDGITGYKVKVYDSEGDEVTFLTPPSDITSPITVTGLTNGESYTFKVVAYNVLGEGVLSDVSDAVTPMGTQTAPTGLTAVAPTTSANNDGKILGVTTAMEYKLKTATEWTAITDTDITGLAAGEYEVRYKETPTDKASPTASVIVPEYEQPAQVETPVASPVGGAVVSGTTVTLSTSTDSATIYYTTDGSTPTTTSTTYDSAITITTATTIKAIAVKDGMTNSTVMSESYTITLPAPTDVSAIASDSSATISFTPLTNTDGITGYKVKVYDSEGDEVIFLTPPSDTTSPITVTGLTNGESYTFKVVAYNELGEGVLSDVSDAVTPMGTQTAPTSLTAVAPTTSANNDGKISGVTTAMEYKLKTATEWTAVTDVDITGLAAGEYEVRYKETATKKASPITTAIVLAYTAPSGGTTPPPTNTNTDNVIVIVNGKEESIGQAQTSTVGTQTQLTLTVDETKLQEKLETEGNNATVIIPVTNTDADVIVGQLNGQMVKNMEDKQATVIVQTGNASYTLPANEINIDAISKQLGQNVDLKDIQINIEIAKPADETVKVVEDAAQQGNFTLMVPPVEFKVTYTSGDKSGEVSRFNAYVERTIAIPDGVDPNKITTGLVVNPDGSTYHVPTKIVQKDGKYYAVINSLTNSLYSVIWHPVAFNDVSNHWAKDAINNLGSRMVVNGVSEGTFAPNQDITRAQFAAIIVRGLGLKPGVGSNNFGDVAKDAWYADYISTATEYSLITGYTNGNFGPNDKITRQQAFAIIARAMALTDLKTDLNSTEVTKVLSTFKDTNKIATYAKPYVALAVQKGIVNGRSNQTIAPSDNITRAEVATIIERLLKKSDLINE